MPPPLCHKFSQSRTLMQNANWDPRFGHDPSLIKMREINTLYNRDNVRTRIGVLIVLC